MPGRKRAAHAMPRPRLSRSRVDRPLVSPTAPELPASIWQLVADILAQTSPFSALMLSMTCRAARESIREDDQLWIGVLRAFEHRFWEKAKRDRHYVRHRRQPLPFVTLGAQPNFLCNGVTVSFVPTRHHGYQLPRDAMPLLQEEGLLPAE